MDASAMAGRAEFHPVAARVVGWLVALLTPRIERNGTSGEDGRLVLRADISITAQGTRIGIASAQRIENRGSAAVRLCWTVPQPPVASAHAIGVRVGAALASSAACRPAMAERGVQRAWREGRSAVVLRQTGLVSASLAAGWLTPKGAMTVTSDHVYGLESETAASAPTLHVRLDAALPSCGGSLRPPGATWPSRRRASDVHPAAAACLLSGVLARLRRRATAGVACLDAARGRAVFRGQLAGCPVRVLLLRVTAPDAGRTAPPAYDRIERLLRAYREPFCPDAERAHLARSVTALGLRHGLLTPWTALLAVDSRSQGSTLLPARASEA
jgi:hypothetical protein